MSNLHKESQILINLYQKINESIKLVKALTNKFIKQTDEDLTLYASFMKRIEPDREEILMKEGEIALGFYFVESGLLRQFYFKDECEITEHFAFEGQDMMCIESINKCNNFTT